MNGDDANFLVDDLTLVFAGVFRPFARTTAAQAAEEEEEQETTDDAAENDEELPREHRRFSRH